VRTYWQTTRHKHDKTPSTVVSSVQATQQTTSSLGKLYLDNTSGTYQNNTHNVAGKPQHTQLQQTVIKNYKAQALADAW
jgi:hypothetical protein